MTNMEKDIKLLQKQLSDLTISMNATIVKYSEVLTKQKDNVQIGPTCTVQTRK